MELPFTDFTLLDSWIYPNTPYGFYLVEYTQETGLDGDFNAKHTTLEIWNITGQITVLDSLNPTGLKDVK